MADKERFESPTGIEQDVQITERTKHAMENYFNWLQNAMSASPWSTIDLNKKLMSYATDNVTAAVGLVQKLSQAKNLEDVVKIQTDFTSKQLKEHESSVARPTVHCRCFAWRAGHRRPATSTPVIYYKGYFMFGNAT